MHSNKASGALCLMMNNLKVVSDKPISMEIPSSTYSQRNKAFRVLKDKFSCIVENPIPYNNKISTAILREGR